MFFPLAIIIIGVILLLENLNIITGNVWGWIWPSLIIIMGLSMMFKPWRHRYGQPVNQEMVEKSGDKEETSSAKPEEAEFEEKN